MIFLCASCNILVLRSIKNKNKLASLSDRRHQKLISPKSYSEDVFLSDTSPQTSPYPTGSSVFLSSTLSGKLKHSRSGSTKSLQGHELRHSRGLGSLEETDEWAEKKMNRLSPLLHDQMKFSQRTRSLNDSRELSSPKNTAETFPKAKEQHQSPKKTVSQVEDAMLSRSKLPPMGNTKIQTVNQEKARLRHQAESSLQQMEHQQGHHRRSKNTSSRESLGDENKNDEKGTPQLRRYTLGSVKRTRPGLEQESFKRSEGEFLRHRTMSVTARESETSRNKDQELRDVNGNPAENKNKSKGTVNKRDSLSFFKDLWSRKDSEASSQDTKGRERKSSNFKERRNKEDSVASTDSIPGTTQSQKGHVGPGPRKLTSSAKILTKAEVLRGPL